MEFDNNRENLEIKFECLQEVVVGVEYYRGKYHVTPTTEGETLQTKEKYMTDDLTIDPVPRYDVSNTSGGTTIFIASEVE